MKSTKITHKASSKETKYYKPDEALVRWFSERLEFEKERKQLQSRKKAGGKLPNSFQKKLNNSSARKADILSDIVFPSMANLIYFFEAITMSPQLDKIFEKDLIDLLDPRSTKKAAEWRSESSTPQTSFIFRRNNFARLISAIVMVDRFMLEDGKPVKDFRISLLYQMMSIINDKMRAFFESEYGYVNQITKSALTNFQDILGWLALAASVTDDNSNKIPDRDIGFSHIRSSNKANLRNLQW